MKESSEAGLCNEECLKQQAKDRSLSDIQNVLQTAQITPVCDRTEQVQRDIMYTLEKQDCSKVTIKDLESITFLNFSGAKIKKLKSGDFSGLTSLKLLYLIDNDFRSLPDDIFSQNPNLVILDLSNNRLEELPDLSNNRKIGHLELNSNNFKKPPNISQLSNLEYFDFKENHRLRQPPNLSANRELLSVEITGQQLSSFPDVSNLSKLRKLVVGVASQGSQPPPNLSNNPRLKILHISGKEFKEPPDVTYNLELEEIRISGKLNGIPPNYLLKNYAVRKVFLGDVNRKWSKQSLDRFREIHEEAKRRRQNWVDPLEIILPPPPF